VLEERTYIEQYVFQLEEGAGGRRHYQGSLRCDVKKAKGTLLADFRRAGLNCKQLTFLPLSNNGRAAQAADFYCTKVDTRIAGPWADASWRPPKKKSKYECKDLEMMEHPLLWQKAVLDWIEGPSDDRTVRWIYNPAGNAGKSKLQKWLCYNQKATRVPLGNATQLKTAVCDIGQSAVYLLDMPRVTGSTEAIRDLFSALEEIKNGWVASAMYGKPRELFMEPPHVIIFSNSLPDLKLASADRWKVYYLEDKDDFLHYWSAARVGAAWLEARQAESGADAVNPDSAPSRYF